MGINHVERIIRAALRRAGRDSSPAAVAAVIADIETRQALREAERQRNRQTEKHGGGEDDK